MQVILKYAGKYFEVDPDMIGLQFNSPNDYTVNDLSFIKDIDDTTVETLKATEFQVDKKPFPLKVDELPEGSKLFVYLEKEDADQSAEVPTEEKQPKTEMESETDPSSEPKSNPTLDQEEGPSSPEVKTSPVEEPERPSAETAGIGNTFLLTPDIDSVKALSMPDSIDGLTATLTSAITQIEAATASAMSQGHESKFPSKIIFSWEQDKRNRSLLIAFYSDGSGLVAMTNGVVLYYDHIDLSTIPSDSAVMLVFSAPPGEVFAVDAIGVLRSRESVEALVKSRGTLAPEIMYYDLFIEDEMIQIRNDLYLGINLWNS